MNQKRFMLLKRYSHALVLGLALLYGCSGADNELIIDDPPIDPPLIDIYEEDHSFKIIGYFPFYRFSLINQINFNKVTYVNLAFGNLNALGNLAVGNNVDILPIVQQIKSSSNAKVMLSIAGGGDTGNHWGSFLSNIHRKETIQKMVEFVMLNQLDGIDVDIEGALITSLGANYNLFVQELKEHLHAKGKAITAALTAINLNEIISDKTLQSLDFINIMAYDLTGPWQPNNPGPHSPFSMADDALNFWNNTKGIPQEKLVLGVPFYGRDFNPADLKSWTFNSILELNPNYAYKDQVQQIYYNGIPTIVEKSKLALQRANGVMIWELGQDTFNELSLLSAIDQVVKAVDCDPNEIETFYKDNDEDGLGNFMFPIQACEAPIGYVNNRDDLDDESPSS